MTFFGSTMTVEKDNYLVKFQKWLADEGLYSAISLDDKAALSIAKAIDRGGLSVDCYCPYCQETSVFRFGCWCEDEATGYAR